MTDSLFVVFNGISTTLLDHIAAKCKSDGMVKGVWGATRSESDIEYLREEGDVEYEKVFNLEDVRLPETPNLDRLEHLERRNGKPFLYRYILANGGIPTESYEAVRRQLQGWFDFYISIFEDIEPDVLLTNRLDGYYSLIPFEIVKREYGVVLTWKTTRVGNRYAVQVDTISRLTDVEQLFRAFESGSAEPDSFAEAHDNASKYLQRFRETGIKPGYFERREPSFADQLSSGRQFLRRLIQPSGFDASLDSRTSLIRDAHRRFRLRQGDLFEQPVEGEQHIFLPLHAQPEPSTGILGPAYIDQTAFVEQLSRQIPITHRLYVKDHPRMMRDNPRPIRRFKRMASCPSVRIIHPGVDSHALIESSDAVVTVTGTPAFEAALLGTPAITFGRTEFERIPGVTRCSAVSAFPETLSELRRTFDYDEEAILHYLTSIFEHSVELPSDLMALSQREQRIAADRIHHLLTEHFPKGSSGN